MRLENIAIRNFRLLRRLSIDLASGTPTTVLVGPNNSGKTSVMEALRLFLGPASELRKKLSLHDLSQSRRADFDHIESRIAVASTEDEKIAIMRRYAPRVRMDLVFSYDEDTADLVVATELLMNLNPADNRIGLRIECCLANAKGLLADFLERRKQEESLCEFLTTRFAQYYDVSYFKVAPDGREAEELDGGEIVRRLIKVDMITAQRHIDDDESSRAAKLSKLLHDHYSKYYQAEDLEGFNAIEDAISESAAGLTEKYGGAFGRLTTRLKSFGYPQGHTTPDLRIRAEMDATTIYRDNTRIYYASAHQTRSGTAQIYELPEKYNGLGYKNLIFIVLQLESFRAALEAVTEDRPRVHVIGIEEPEAHLHPQVQCVFISEMTKALSGHAGSTAQILISTHSSHIVADSGFDPIRYFRRTAHEVSVRDLSRLPLPEDGDVLNFLRRYVKLTHCDLFFADKAILVEGQVERLLLPVMLRKCADREGCEDLAREYISVSEVGGAYAHKFKPLIEFIGIPTLVITDLDAVDAEGRKCPVADGCGTSNAALREWLPGERALPALMAAGEDARTSGHLHVVYQKPEAGQCGRSFEEAFIYANLAWLADNHGSLAATGARFAVAAEVDLAGQAYDLSGKLAKVDFALDLLTTDGWAMPAYIAAGLEWLAKQGTAR